MNFTFYFDGLLFEENERRNCELLLTTRKSKHVSVTSGNYVSTKATYTLANVRKFLCACFVAGYSGILSVKIGQVRDESYLLRMIK